MGNLDLNSSKVYQILSAMSTEERERFGTFMRSPYFNTRPQLVELFDILIATFTSKSGKTPLKSDAYRLLFKVKKEGFDYDSKMDSHLRKLLSDLKGLADRFLGVEGFFSRESNATPFVLEAYRRMKLNRHFELHVDEALEAMPLGFADTPLLIQRHVLETLKYEYLVNDRKWDEVTSLPGESLMLFYYVERYKQLCEFFLFGRVVKDFHFPTGTAIPTVIPPEMEDQFPLAKFYRLFYELLTQDKGDLNFLRQLVKELCDRMDWEECRRMYAYLENYCQGRIHRGDPSMRPVMMELQLDRLAIEKTVLAVSLTNMIHAAGNEKDVERAKLLYLEGKKKLINDPDGSVDQYLRAYLHYIQGEFALARKLLFSLNPIDERMELNIRMVEIKAWWEDEAEDDEFTLTKINNFLRHLRRGYKLPPARRKLQEEKYRFAAKIIKSRYDPESLQKHLAEALKKTDLLDKDYLIERIQAYLEK
jgi:hypothetical protein